MNEDVDVLSYILLPLAGPEEYTTEDNDMFPTDLQVRISTHASLFEGIKKINSSW